MPNRICITVLGLLALAGWSSSRAWASPQGRATGPESIESAFRRAWGAVSTGAKKTAEAGEWVIERGADGAVVASRKIAKGGKEAAREIDDAAILASIKSKLAVDSKTSAVDIHVDVENGNVTLRGDVKSSTEAETAMRLTTETSGVRRAVSRLRWPGMSMPPKESGDRPGR